MSRFHFPCTGKNKLPVDKCRLSRNGGFRFSRGEGGGGGVGFENKICRVYGLQFSLKIT